MEDADYLIPIVTKAVSNNYYTINTTEQNVTNKTKLREQNIALKVGVHLRSQDAIFGLFIVSHTIIHLNRKVLISRQS